MAISVTTGGPQQQLALPQQTQFLTYQDMIAQISDELDDIQDSYLPQIQNAVLSAIRFCSSEPFYFNQNRSVILTVKPGYACYDAQDNPALAYPGSISGIDCEDRGQVFALNRERAEVLQQLAGGKVMMGLPCLYSFYGQQLCFYPVPDKNYAMRLLLNPARLPAMQESENCNPWFTEAFDLIKARAKYDIYKDILKDAPMAAAAFNDFKEAWQALAAETSRRSGVRRVRATQF